MKTEVRSITMTQIIEPTDIPDGDYPAKWSGYIVDLAIGNKSYMMMTKDGVRGIDIPCTVIVQGNNVYIKT